MRRQFYARHKSHSSDAQPEESSSKEQNHNADERADKWNSEVRGISLDGHRVEAFAAADHRYIYLLRISLRSYLISLVGFQPRLSLRLRVKAIHGRARITLGLRDDK